MPDYEERDGIIVSPGKFEGQCRYMPDMYQRYLEGFCDDDGTVVTVDITLQDRETYPELAAKNRRGTFKRNVVKFVVTDQGFVEER